MGWVAGLLWPPIILDDPFWRAFWSGPPVAGLFAVVGAVIAYTAAQVGARTARRAAEREEWWNRAEWALDLARSDTQSDRLIGLRALEGLKEQATKSEAAMILAVTGAVTGDDGTDGFEEAGSSSAGDVDVDMLSEQAEDGERKRWFEWVSKNALVLSLVGLLLARRTQSVTKSGKS